MLGSLSLLLFTGCQSETTDYRGITYEQYVGEERDTLDAWANSLASEPEWTAALPEDAFAGGAEFPLSRLISLAPGPIQSPDSRTLELSIAKYARQAESAPDSSEYLFGIAGDPDRHDDGAATFTVYLASRTSPGEVIERVVTMENGDTAELDALEVPLYFVTVVDVTDRSSVETAPTDPGGASAKVATYLCISRVYLSGTEDSASSDEFELYVETGSSSSLSYAYLPKYAGYSESSSSTYQYKFDGGAHSDASGASLTLPDVNNNLTNYDVSGTFAIAPLSASCYVTIKAVEDDSTSGEFKAGAGANSNSTRKNCSSVQSADLSRSDSLWNATPSATSVTSGAKSTVYHRYASTGSDDHYTGVVSGISSAHGTATVVYTAGQYSLYLYKCTK